MLNAGSAGHGFTSGSRKSEAGIIKFLSNQFGDQLKQMFRFLGIFYNGASFKSSMDQCFKQLSLNDIPSFAEQSWRMSCYPQCGDIGMYRV